MTTISDAKNGLIRVASQGTAAIDEAVANAIGLWAEGSSDSESLRRDDIIRNKTRTVEAFFAFAGKSPSEVRPADVKAWRDHLRERRLALATVCCRLSFLSSFYTWLMRDPDLGEQIQKNPVTLARPKAPRAYQTESAKALTDDELEKLRAVIRSHVNGGGISAMRDYALYLFFVISGMRRAEVIGLKGEDLKLREDGVIVSCRVKGGDYVSRLISSTAVRDALIDYLTAAGRRDVLETVRPLWVRHDRGSEAVSIEEPLTAWAFVQRMKAYAKEAGIDRFHLHQTRHTFARIVGETSGSMVETQDALGHKDPATTRVYLQRIAVKGDKFSEAITKRMKL